MHVLMKFQRQKPIIANSQYIQRCRQTTIHNSQLLIISNATVLLNINNKINKIKWEMRKRRSRNTEKNAYEQIIDIAAGKHS